MELRSSPPSLSKAGRPGGGTRSEPLSRVAPEQKPTVQNWLQSGHRVTRPRAIQPSAGETRVHATDMGRNCIDETSHSSVGTKNLSHCSLS